MGKGQKCARRHAGKLLWDQGKGAEAEVNRLEKRLNYHM